ncbi:RNA recognition motif domain-containing protein [Vibrio japonicus]|uniref:RNA-binding protein n=1 Tax=Vibrio japonicus TaxID=1824638 RepID=A0ABY5LFD7_9VIBR|nr:RNA-binding protein [Vibrio japonicus]UUM30752.1 RNA-binding protein [Vibrio japonicus]
MNSNKSILAIVALAVLGGIIFSLVQISSAISFVIGVLSCSFIIKLLDTNPVEEQHTDPSTNTLYVGNLPYKANESDVKELFSKYGEVFAVRLMKDKRTGKRRGFGFVVMAAEDTQSAIDALNENEYMQRTLKVRIANDPKSPDESEGQD